MYTGQQRRYALGINSLKVKSNNRIGNLLNNQEGKSRRTYVIVKHEICGRTAYFEFQVRLDAVVDDKGGGYFARKAT